MKAALVVALLTASAAANADSLSPLVERRGDQLVGVREISSELGLDGAIAAKLRFAIGVAAVGERLELASWIEVGAAAGNADLADHIVRAGSRIRVARAGRFSVHASLAVVRRATTNTGFAAHTIGTELVVAPRVQLGRFTGAVELGSEQAWLAYIAPTDAYRELVYAMAEPGWHTLPSVTLRIGGAAAVRIASVELTARFGYARTGGLDFLPQLYGSLGAGYRF